MFTFFMLKKTSCLWCLVFLIGFDPEYFIDGTEAITSCQHDPYSDHKQDCFSYCIFPKIDSSSDDKRREEVSNGCVFLSYIFHNLFSLALLYNKDREK